ncbi:hypothetical protein B0H19DRAFT_426390 [Mycena capillaripes]|nr:hypothetical protein B0H19DRAFT_426390 [Mycena capillaripes]
MMYSRLPPELTDRIIDFLWDSHPDLRTCSLVCSQWLPSSRRHLFELVMAQTDDRFLALWQSPSNFLSSHARILDFGRWSKITDARIPIMLQALPTVRHLRTIIIGSFLPSPEAFPLLPHVPKLSLQHTKFGSCADFTRFISKFAGLRKLELGSVGWEDASHKICPRLKLELEYLSIEGFQQSPDILQWLSCTEYAPRTHGLALYIPDNPNPASLRIVSKYLHRLNGTVRYLRLDLFPSSSLQWANAMPELGSLTSLQRLRIGHSVQFHPPSTPESTGTCRVFPAVVLALRFTSKNHLDELIFDVDVAPDTWSSNSDSFLLNLLANTAVEQIPAVRFHVLRGRRSCEAAAMHCRQFASSMSKREVGSRNVVYSSDKRGSLK